MSNKQVIIDEISELFRTPAAFLCNAGPSEYGDVFKVVSWGACKSYLSWPEGDAPEGWGDLDECIEFFVGRSGDRFVTVRAEDDTVTRLYARNENNIEDTAEHICWALDLPEHEDNEWEELS